MVVVHPNPPQAPPPVTPHRRGTLFAEWRFGAQAARVLWHRRRLRRAPRGQGSPVVLMPGWQGPELTMAPLQHYLRRLGHDARPWGLGTNTGDPERDRDLMLPKVEAIATQTGRPVALVGWSLGGVVAREVARSAPAYVSKVITFGTPAVGGPLWTVGRAAWGEEECRRISEGTDELDRTQPIEVPITAIFTRNDAAVSWPACIDRRSPDVEHVEVRSSHIGLALDPDVWWMVATRLSEV